MKNIRKSMKDNAGITLVELIVVIAILSILTGLAGPQFISYANRKRAEACAQHREAVLDVVEECVYSDQIVMDDDGDFEEFGVANLDTYTSISEQYKNKLKDHMVSQCPKGGTIKVKIEAGIAKCYCSCPEHTDADPDYGDLYGDRVADLTAWRGQGGDYGEVDNDPVPDIKPKHMVNVMASPAEAASVAGGKEYNEGATVSVNYTINEGYRFSKWVITGTEVSEADCLKRKVTFVMPENDVTCIAMFTKIPKGPTLDYGLFPYPDDPRWDDPAVNPLGKQSGAYIEVDAPSDRFASRTDDGAEPIQFVVINQGNKGKVKIFWDYCEGPQIYMREFDNNFIIKLTGVIFDGTDSLNSYIAEEFKDHPQDNKYRFAHGDVYKDPATGLEYVYWGNENSTKLPTIGTINGNGMWCVIGNEAYKNSGM